MTDPFANKGFIGLSGTSPIDLSDTPIGGFTPIGGDLEIDSITHPSAVNGTGYTGDASFIADKTFKEGVFYPLPAISLTLSSGQAIGWLQD